MRPFTPYEAATLERLLVAQEVILLKRKAICVRELSVEGDQEIRIRDVAARAELDRQEMELLDAEERILLEARGR